MTSVLDTNALVWAFEAAPMLGAKARRVIDEAVLEGTACVSAISFWELAIKVRKGKLGLTRDLRDWRANVLRLGVREIPVDGIIGIASNELRDFHDDPADRIIAATALTMGGSLVTSDAKLLAWKGPLACLDARV